MHRHGCKYLFSHEVSFDVNFSFSVAIAARSAAVFGRHVHHKLVDCLDYVRHYFGDMALRASPEVGYQLGQLYASARLQVSLLNSRVFSSLVHTHRKRFLFFLNPIYAENLSVFRLSLSFRSALKYSLDLSKVEEHVKNYRPQVLLLSGKPSDRPALLDFCHTLTKGTWPWLHGTQLS